MQIILTDDEKQEFFYSALCNIGNYLNGYGLEVNWDEKDYKTSRQNLLNQNPGKSICLEDVLMQMLRDGKEIKINDIEGDGDQNTVITMEKINANIEKTPMQHLVDMKDENDDIITADAIIQTVAWGEIIFG